MAEKGGFFSENSIAAWETTVIAWVIFMVRVCRSSRDDDFQSSDMFFYENTSGWIYFGCLVGGFNPSERYYSSQIGSFPQIGVKIKHIWNHHLVFSCLPEQIIDKWCLASISPRRVNSCFDQTDTSCIPQCLFELAPYTKHVPFLYVNVIMLF